MYDQFNSSVQFISQVLDCRQLTLSIHYSFLNRDAISEITKKVLSYLQEITEDRFSFRWYCNGKVITHKRILNNQDWRITDNSAMRIMFDAYVENRVTHNSSTILKYQKELPMHFYEYQSRFHITPHAEESSIDYPTFFDDLFTNTRQDNSQIIDNIMNIFQAKNRKLLAFHKHPDLGGQLYAEPYSKFPDLFYGSLQISFSAFCLGSHVDNMANSLAQFACDMSDSFVNINAHVMLQPQDFTGLQRKSPYMRYFGNNLIEDNSYEDAQCSPKEWFPTYYLCGVEWFNILSPQAKYHIREMASHQNRTDIYIHMHDSGSLLVKSTKPITQYSYDDACEIKRIVLPALFPGKNAIPLRAIYPWSGSQRVYAWCPRNDWAIVPVVQTELKIIGTDIVFCAESSSLKKL